MPWVSREQREATTVRLRHLRQAGDLSAEHVRLAASGLGITERTVWRWLATPEQGRKPQGRAPYRLTDTDREAYAYFRGNVAAVHRARTAAVSGSGSAAEVRAAGVAVPDFLRAGWADAAAVSLRTLQESFARELTPAERAAWRTGEEGRRVASVYLTRAPAHRNQIWELDHKQLPVLVLPPRGTAVCPWLTTIVDDGTRALVGWAISLTPHAGTVLTAIRMALVYDPARGPFGAVPASFRIDRGLEFAARAVGDVFAALCVTGHRLPAYQPHRKGKVERLHATIDTTLMSGLPGFTGGPRDAAGKLYGPLDDRAAARARARAADPGTGGAGEAAVRPMRIERFAETFASWARWYNTERPHTGLGGRTPAQAWSEDTTALVRIGAEQLRHLLLAEAERTIGKDGIRWGGLSYVAPELQGRGGQKVAVRYMPHDDRFLEVYLNGAHLCTAHPAERLTAEQAEAFREHARAESRRLGRARRRATARARTELVPLTGDGPATESRILPARAGDELAARRSDERLRRRARTNLLGLTDPTTQATPAPLEPAQPDPGEPAPPGMIEPTCPTASDSAAAPAADAAADSTAGQES
ncbi:Mu transposase C-terminal domain-containing protein [Actinomadura terrae]|uniref:Mu transposase C-terminal domain-containing protein n=1 Tax=Actinomadura terrae TaxID=604353 RepID=UPI001FA8075F|nr:Mu transposase C-terminal domain-containing protein [Actinomadura terrae]